MTRGTFKRMIIARRTHTMRMHGRDTTVYHLPDGNRMVALGPFLRAALGKSSLRALEALQRLPAALRGQLRVFHAPDGTQILGVPQGWISELAALDPGAVPAELLGLWELARAPMGGEAA